MRIAASSAQVGDICHNPNYGHCKIQDRPTGVKTGQRRAADGADNIGTALLLELPDRAAADKFSERYMAETHDVLRREIKALAFDQYGTIVDMQKGLTEAVTPFLKRKGWDGKPNSFVTWWRRTHFENSMIDALCDRGHTPYRQIGHRAVSYVMERCGIAVTQEEVSWLVSEIEKLKPFSDVVAALEKLRTSGYKLTILSNGDRDMLKAAGPHIGFKFDHVISVQEAGTFKPHWKTYAKAEEIIGYDRSSILFVANHAFDCIGAKSYGMRTAFIDRRKRPFGETPHQPDLIVTNFAELAAVLTR